MNLAPAIGLETRNPIRRPWLLVPGVPLVVVGIAGFASVADDLLHWGELAGVSALLVSGLALVAAARGYLAGVLNLVWLPVGLFAAIAVGAFFDVVAWSFPIGLLAGLALARGKRGARA